MQPHDRVEFKEPRKNGDDLTGVWVIVEIDGDAARLQQGNQWFSTKMENLRPVGPPRRPPYNHSREDSYLTPCSECEVMQKAVNEHWETFWTPGRLHKLASDIIKTWDSDAGPTGVKWRTSTPPTDAELTEFSNAYSFGVAQVMRCLKMVNDSREEAWSEIEILKAELAVAQRGGLDPEPHPSLQVDSDSEDRAVYHEATRRLQLEHMAIALGTQDQRQRALDAGGWLPEEELVTIARTELYKPFLQFTKWTPLKWSEVHHMDGCSGRVDVGSRPIEFMDTAFSNVEQLDNYQRLTQVAATVATTHVWLIKSRQVFKLSIRRHEARCADCGAHLEKFSVLVSINWAGRPLSREFEL